VILTKDTIKITIISGESGSSPLCVYKKDEINPQMMNYIEMSSYSEFNKGGDVTWRYSVPTIRNGFSPFDTVCESEKKNGYFSEFLSIGAISIQGTSGKYSGTAIDEAKKIIEKIKILK
jgi:hypothetical protein